MKTRDFLTEMAVEQIITELGYDLSEPSLSETPRRVTKYLTEYIKHTPADLQKLIDKMKTFTEKGYDQLIIKRGIKMHSLCEHHLLPFVGTVDIAYIPKMNEDGSCDVVGTSKLARIVKYFSMQFSIQERLTAEIADFIDKYLEARGTWVIIRATHMCEKIRGIRNGAEMVTSKITGLFRENDSLRRETEFLLSSH